VTPARSARFLQVARWYVRRRMGAAFDGVYVSGLAAARERAAKQPLVFAMNHVSWWDAFVVVAIDEALGTESYCLMDSANLARLPFFGWIGAVPLTRSHPRTALRELRAAAGLLDRPRRVGWIFPQGKQRPAHLRPMGLERGVGIFAAASGAEVLPVSLSYAFRDAPEPAVVASIGQPCAVPRNGAPDELEQALIAGLDANDAFITSGAGAFTCVVPPRRRNGTTGEARLLAMIGGGNRA
jgi:1-acyl-sn-glycerol-3-phosphate acyltransferase